MTTNQKAALSDAQVQPSPSSRPNTTRLRPGVPVLSACPAIVLHPWRGPVGPAPRVDYLTVSSPTMFGCHLQTNL